jgi:2-methylisocitrate lyase-like PEP mutase family enzyme
MNAHAETFAKLHQGPELLILPNAWDAMSACTVAHAGAKAVATSSAAVAWALGFPDGEAVPADLVLSTIRSIARIVSLPVTADIEAAYAGDAAAAGAFAEKVIDAGTVGVNIEDATAPPALLCSKIEALQKTAVRKGVALWVNARVDVYLRNLAQGEGALSEVLKRAKLYAGAGANSIFVPGAADPDLIRTLAGEIKLPLNILAWPGVPDAATLTSLGVRRLSAGAGLAKATMNKAHEIAAAFLATGRSDLFAGGPLAQVNFNMLMKK